MSQNQKPSQSPFNLNNTNSDPFSLMNSNPLSNSNTLPPQSQPNSSNQQDPFTCNFNQNQNIFQQPPQIPQMSNPFQQQPQPLFQQQDPNQNNSTLPVFSNQMQQPQINQNQNQNLQYQQAPPQLPNIFQQAPNQQQGAYLFPQQLFQTPQIPNQMQFQTSGFGNVQMPPMMNNNYNFQQNPFIRPQAKNLSSEDQKARITEDPVNENLSKVKNNQENVEFDFDKEFDVEVQAPYQFYKMSQASQTIPVKLSLSTMNSILNVEKDLLNRANIDLICVVDISGSMSGEKLELVKKTLKYILTILTENDRFSLVVFDDHGEQLIALKRVSEVNQALFNNVINVMNVRGGTCIDSGVSKALQDIKNRKYKNEITSIFLLSDGVDNVGSQALGVIQNSISKAKIQDHFTISTFGFGKDHDANVMREIAKNNGGNFYFIDNLQSIDECFVDAMGILFSVVLKDIEVSLKLNNQAPFSDMRVKKTYGDMWKYNEETKVHQIKVKLFTKGQKKDYICEINLPPCKKELQDEEKYRSILSVELIGKSVKDTVVVKKTELLVHFLNNADPIQGQNDVNADVVVNHLRVKGAEKLELAKDFAQKRQFTEAQNELDLILKELEECTCKDHPTLVILKSDIEKSKNYCKPQNFSNEGLSYITSFSNNNMYQQSCPMSNVGNVRNVYSTPMQAMMNQNLMTKKGNNN